MQMPGRKGGSGYRYGFQGQERDDELKGEGNSLNYEYRMHDPRIGRFFAIDPLASKYPYWTPYAFSGNQVIHMVELEGLEPASRGNAGTYMGLRSSGLSHTNAQKVIDGMVMAEQRAIAPMAKSSFGTAVVAAVVADVYFTGGRVTSSVILLHFFQKSIDNYADITGMEKMSGFDYFGLALTPSIMPAISRLAPASKALEEVKVFRKPGAFETPPEPIIPQGFSMAAKEPLITVSGTARAKPSGTPNSIYTYLSSDGKAVSNYIYDADGNVSYQVDFGNHRGGMVSGHGHVMTEPGNFASGHTVDTHVPLSDVPKEYLVIPEGAQHSTPIGE